MVKYSYLHLVTVCHDHCCHVLQTQAFEHGPALHQKGQKFPVTTVNDLFSKTWIELELRIEQDQQSLLHSRLGQTFDLIFSLQDDFSGVFL